MVRSPLKIAGDTIDSAFRNAVINKIQTTNATSVDNDVAFARVFNVKNYGAVGDGVTDDSAAIQAAINAVPSGGGTVFFPLATYFIATNSQITLKSNLTLDFNGSTIKTSSQLWTVNPGFVGTSLNNVKIVGMIFDGTQGTGVSGIEPLDFIGFTGSKNIRIENCRGENMSGTLINFKPPINTDITVRNCFVGETDAGVSGGFVTFDTVSNGIIAGNILFVWDSGPLIARSSHLDIHDNVITTRRGVGLDLNNQTASDIIEDLDIHDNIIIGATESAQVSIFIHDTGTPGTSGTFKKIRLHGNFVDGKGISNAIIITVSNPAEGIAIKDNWVFNGSPQSITIRLQSDQRGWDISGNTMAHTTGASNFGINNTESGVFVLRNSRITNNTIIDSKICIQARLDNCIVNENILGDFQIGSVANANALIGIFQNFSTFTNNTISNNKFVTKGGEAVFGQTVDSTNRINNNAGFNPQGVAAITPGASPYTYTNNDGVPEVIHIDGGTITTVAKNAITLYSFGGTAARCAVWLEPGEAVTVTYTVVPTVNKDRK